jgi:hypothetical protein
VLCQHPTWHWDHTQMKTALLCNSCLGLIAVKFTEIKCLGLSPALENPHTHRWVVVGVVRIQLPPARSACTKVPICKSSTGATACVQLFTALRSPSIFGMRSSVTSVSSISPLLTSSTVRCAKVRLKSHPLRSEKYQFQEAAQVCQMHMERFRLHSSDRQQWA